MISNNNYNNFFKYTSIEICNSSLHSPLNRIAQKILSSRIRPIFQNSQNGTPRISTATTPLEQQIRRNRLRRAEQKRYQEKTSNVEPQGWIN